MMELAELNLDAHDGVMVLVVRKDGTPEIHFPQLGRLTEGRIEQATMLMYRRLMEARAHEARDLRMKELGLEPANLREPEGEET